MKISYLGYLSVAVKGKSSTVLFNPFDKSTVGVNLKKSDADIVLSSNLTASCSDYSKVSEEAYKVTGPGEYEVNEVMILGYPMLEKISDESEKKMNKNTIYRVEIGGVSICHLGALSRKLTDEEVDNIGTVDVLIIPVGNGELLDSKSVAEVVNKIEPSVVIPVAYKDESYTGKYADLLPYEKFMEAMGSAKTDMESYLNIKKSDINSEGEGVKVVLLERK